MLKVGLPPDTPYPIQLDIPSLTNPQVWILETVAPPPCLHRDLGYYSDLHHTDALSEKDKFRYRYFPALVSVVYGLLWMWIDHDIKRLEA